MLHPARFRWLAATWLVLAVGASSAAAAPAFDWRAWRAIPVHHNGRIMPLDSFAREMIETICHRERPTLAYQGSPRRFEAAELLFHWLVEPQRWEDVPFLLAEHEELRRDVLHVPLTDEHGRHQRYVSPREVRQSDHFWQRVAEIARRQHAAGVDGDRQLQRVDQKVEQLYKAYVLFQNLTLTRQLDARSRGRYGHELSILDEQWQNLSRELQGIAAASQDTEWDELLLRGRHGISQLHEVAQRPDVLLPDADAVASGFVGIATAIAQRADREGTAVHVAAGARELSAQARRVHRSLYDNDEALCVVPALHEAALHKHRRLEDATPPWLDLQTLLFAPPQVLADYPQQQVQEVARRFEQVRMEFAAEAVDGEKLAAAVERFAAALARLGHAVESRRRTLPLADRDDEFLEATAYPAAGKLVAELHYNRLDPFGRAWMINLAAFACFALAFAALRRPMYWCGAVILSLGLVWCAYGFCLRVAVTGWAPVTNMYETVIFVPFIVAALGLGFAVAPLTVDAVRGAWRLTALPGTREAGPLDPVRRSWMRADYWSMWGVLLALPRLALTGLVFAALTVSPLAAGQRPIVSWRPNITFSSALADFNAWLTWAVGLAVLVLSMWYVPRGVLSLLAAPWLLVRCLRGVFGERCREAYERQPFLLAASFVAFFGAFVAWYSPVLDKRFAPLQPVLRDNFWLTIHVLTIVSSYGAGALAWSLGNLSLWHHMRSGTKARRTCAQLADYVYKSIQVAVVLLAAGTVLGGLWADVSWGRFWGWDPKEVWALISLLTYLAILHARYAGWIGHFGLAAGAVAGATAIMMSWYGVNFVLGAGLHSYGFGSGGQAEVFGLIALNWGFLLVAWLRYRKCATRADDAVGDDGGVAVGTVMQVSPTSRRAHARLRA